MDLELLYRSHKLLHFIVPIVIIFALQKRLGLVKVCLALFIAGFLKEIYDTVALTDSLWVSTMDIASNIVGIGLGIVVAKTKPENFRLRNWK